MSKLNIEFEWATPTHLDNTLQQAVVHRLSFALLLDKIQHCSTDIISDYVVNYVFETLHADVSHRRQVLTWQNKQRRTSGVKNSVALSCQHTCTTP
jgi:hypothetical protein